MKHILIMSAFCLNIFANDCTGSHDIVQGDNFHSVSRKYSTSVDSIKKCNEKIDMLKIGQKIKIPSSKTEQKVEIKEEKKEEPKNTNTHIVKTGETLYSISKKYSIPYEKIIEENNLPSNNIKIGSKIVIPQAGSDKNEKITEQKNEKTVEKQVENKNITEEFFLSSFKIPLEEGKIGSSNVNGVYFYKEGGASANVIASHAGKVILASKLNNESSKLSSKYFIVISHDVSGKKYLTSYGNIDSVFVKKDDKIIQGQIIGSIQKNYDNEIKLFFIPMDKEGVMPIKKISFK